MTYLELVNAVFTRLRQPNLVSLDSAAYTLLVGAFVNQAKREVEDAHKWSALYTDTTIATVAGTKTYTLTGYGDRSTIAEVIDATNDGPLTATSAHWINRRRLFGADQNSRPNWWAIKGTSGGDPVLELYHTPDAVYSIRVQAYVPQADLSVGTEVLKVPHWPVVLGAYAKAVSERGEDGGLIYDETVRDYDRALTQAIAQDSKNTSGGHDTDWYVAYGPRA